MTFIELPSFTAAVSELVDDASYGEFQKELMAHPERGDLIPGSGGLRKIRMRLPGRGKRGGARVIYIYLIQHDVVVLFYVYTKSKCENLTPDQLKRLKAAVTTIKKEFKA